MVKGGVITSRRAQGKMRRQRNPNPDEKAAAPKQQPSDYATLDACVISNPDPGDGAADKASRNGAPLDRGYAALYSLLNKRQR